METKQTPGRTVVLGIDPGRITGLYSCSIPKRDRALTLDEFQREARWLGNAAVALSTRESAPLVTRWGEMEERLSSAIFAAKPDLIVLEFPKDGMSKWSGGTGRGVEFSLGMFFGFAAIAADSYSAESGITPPIALMPVTSSKAKSRVGWMPKVTERSKHGNRVVTHTQDRETTLRQCGEIARLLHRNTGASERDNYDHMYALKEHEAMALGVLTYYVTHFAPADWGKDV